MNRDDWLQMHHWLDTASVAELDEHVVHLSGLLDPLLVSPALTPPSRRVHDEGTRKDILTMLRLIEQEKLSRVLFGWPAGRRESPPVAVKTAAVG